MLIENLATPCVLIERRRLRHNLEQMQAKATANRVALRPHVKTHKSTALAKRQRAQGAQGITVAKVAEAEAFVDAGFEDVRLAYTIVGRGKHERLQTLRDRARISFCVDTLEGAQAASAVYAAASNPAEVLLEVDAGYGRCGVLWNAASSVRLARKIAALPGLNLVGILTHAGHAYRGPADGESQAETLHRIATEERDRMLDFAGQLHEAGLASPDTFEISIGSTPTMAVFENNSRHGFSITEIRPGNYVFNDAIQVALGVATLHECALTVQATVVSKHRDSMGRERLFIDAGKKVFTTDTGYQTDGYGIILYNPSDMVPQPHARLTGLSEEHGWVSVLGGATFSVGDRVRIVPNHACVVAHTQNQLYVVDDDEVVDTFAVDA